MLKHIIFALNSTEQKQLWFSPHFPKCWFMACMSFLIASVNCAS